MPLQFVAQGPMALPSGTPSYQGVGDVVAGASYYWGLNAYSSAQCTGSVSAIDVVNASDVAYSGNPIKITTSGDLDDTAAAAAISGGFIYIQKVYEQIGGSNHLTQSGDHTNMPILQRNIFNTNRPAWKTDELANFRLWTTSAFTLAQPFSIATAIIKANSGTAQSVFTGGSMEMSSDAGTSRFRISGGFDNIDQTPTFGSPQMFMGIFAGSGNNGLSRIDATESSTTSGTPGNIGTGGFSSQVATVYRTDSQGGALVVYPSALNSTQRGQAHTKIKSYWGTL